jgi:hypothetical protein
MHQLGRRGLTLVAALVFLPHAAAAQQVATSFERLQRLVKSGDTIYVTTADGRTTSGRLGSMSPGSLELLVPKVGNDGRQTFVPGTPLSEADVREIRLLRRDSLLNGALIGLAIGAGPWLYVQIATGGYGEPGGENLFLWGALFTGAVTATVGTAIDALMTQRPMVYYKPPSRSGRMQIAPVVSASTTALTMSINW